MMITQDANDLEINDLSLSSILPQRVNKLKLRISFQKLVNSGQVTTENPPNPMSDSDLYPGFGSNMYFYFISSRQHILIT